MKPSWKTGEFWLAALLAGLGAYMVLPEGASTPKLIAGVLIAVLPVLYHNARRVDLKLATLAATAPAPLELQP